MRNPERLRAVRQVLREKHEKLHDLQQATVLGMTDALDAEGHAIDATRDVFAAARVAFVEATHALEAARRTLFIISEAQDAITALYDEDNTLEDIVDTDTP